MVNVSKKYINKELQTKAWNVFLCTIRASDSSEILLTNLKKFLTPSEIIMLEKRLSIPLLIGRGMSYKNIGATLDVSSATISFVKHNLTKRSAINREYGARKNPRRKRVAAPVV